MNKLGTPPLLHPAHSPQLMTKDGGKKAEEKPKLSLQMGQSERKYRDFLVALEVRL